MQLNTLVPRVESSQCLSGSLEGFSPLETLWIIGAQVIGSNLSWLLLGFLAAQAYVYHTRSAKDSPVFKILVYSLIFLSGAGETAVEGYVAYTYLVSGWGNPRTEVDDLVPLYVQVDIRPVLAAISAVPVQLFFTWRIWKFCQAVWQRTTKQFVAALCLLIVLISICAFAAAIFLFVNLMTAVAQGPAAEISTLIWSISTAVVDVTITICMMMILYHAKSSAYYGETRDRISRLLRLTIQTGFLTSVMAISIPPLYVSGIGGWDTVTGFLLGKSYVITLLVNLNARSSHQREPMRGVDTPDISALAFTPGQDPVASGTNTTSSNRIMELVRSAKRTIHHTLAASRIEHRDAQTDNGEAVTADPHQDSGE